MIERLKQWFWQFLTLLLIFAIVAMVWQIIGLLIARQKKQEFYYKAVHCG
jgi:hypothetical protein